jgi:hypothetical protein
MFKNNVVVPGGIKKPIFTPINITSLKDNEVFVFGSNLAGIHGGGAAKTALQWGAQMKKGIGHFGQTYALPTKGKDIKTLSLNEIKVYADQFIQYVKENQDKHFLLTEVGCGLAGLTYEQVAPLFVNILTCSNISIPEAFWDVIKPVIKGYKVTNPDGTCRGFLFEVGKEYQYDGQIKICNSGFHFCIKPSHCFSYYSFDSNNKIFEVESIGEYQTHDEDSKICTGNLRIIRQLEWYEVLSISNEGSNNTGYSNTGDSNTGYRNTGDKNTGDKNTGYRNTGDMNTGDSNTGYRNTGDMNTGDNNTGYRNTGYRNTGDMNTGDNNTGYMNTGDMNTGDRNTGYMNTGDRNTGYMNNGNRQSGAFCTGEPAFTLFNKPAKTTCNDFLNSKAWNIICAHVDIKLWIPESLMTDEEKKIHCGYKTCGGFYRDTSYKQAFTNMWQNLSKQDKKEFTSLENFDAKIFEEITGVDVTKEKDLL